MSKRENNCLLFSKANIPKIVCNGTPPALMQYSGMKY